jgi:predicted molibdopterin-dependent oxidoreductase YjgC
MTSGSARVDLGIRRGAEISIIVDGDRVVAFEGETVAAVLIAWGRRNFRYSTVRNQPRSLYCGIGVCWECRMVIDGNINTRACMTQVRSGMVVKTQHGLGDPA